MWGLNLGFTNRENQPINIKATLALSSDEGDSAKRIRLSPLSKPLYEYREDIQSYMYYRPDHLSFPVYIDNGRHVQGQVEFAVQPEIYEGMAAGGSLKQIIMGNNHLLEVEDLISGKKGKFYL